MYKVSIVIPVYNAEKYIEKCIVSLMEQTLDFVEYIIIDDGSNDNSLTIINDIINTYPTKKLHTKIISRGNKGVAFTRNEGLGIATGEYLIFLDSDDYASSQFLELMYNKAVQENSDVVICDYFLDYKNKLVEIHHGSIGTPEQLIIDMLNSEVNGFSWNKLIKRDIYVNDKVNFEPNINYLEDMIYLVKILFHAKNVSTVSECLVYYNQCNNDSLTKNITRDSIQSMIKAIDYLDSLFQYLDVNSKYKENISLQKLKRKSMILSSFENISLKNSCYLSLYPEANSFIFRSGLSLNKKILLLLASKNKLRLVNFFLYILKKLSDYSVHN